MSLFEIHLPVFQIRVFFTLPVTTATSLLIRQVLLVRLVLLIWLVLLIRLMLLLWLMLLNRLMFLIWLALLIR